MKGLKSVAEEWASCTKCPLHETRKTIVFGEGPQSADLMIVGEAPGQVEDSTGKPFRGKSGAVLNSALSNAGIDREKVFFTNAVACRPPNDRDPTKEELLACKPRLQEIVYVVDPIVIVAMGNVAAKALTGKDQKVTTKRGEILSIRIPGVSGEIMYPVLITLHPAFLLRSMDTFEGGWASMFVQDLTLAKALVATVISTGRKGGNQCR